jgi:hypothetical protein
MEGLNLMANYSKHPLDYSYERVRRAEEHIVDLQKQVDNIFKMQRDAFGAYFDPNPPHELRTSLPPETFVVMRFGVVVGEVAYNLRAALDYLVFQLASLDSGSEQSDTQFPISDDPDKFKSNANRRLKGVIPFP